MYEHNQFLNHTHLKNQISEDDLFTYIWFINMIKEHRHDKIKSKHIDKFECLVRKHGGYHPNHQQNLEGHPQFLSDYYNQCFSMWQQLHYTYKGNNNQLYHNNNNQL